MFEESIEKVANRIVKIKYSFKEIIEIILLILNRLNDSVNMKTSQKGIELVKNFEGLHDGDLSRIDLQPKLCPADIWTVGYGRALKYDNGEFIKSDVSFEELKKLKPKYIDITEEQAEEFLKEDLERFEKMVNNNVKISLYQHEFDALVSHTYNTGGSETLFRRVNSKSRPKIKEWFLNHYITANGIELAGLVRRRRSEWVLFDTGELQFNF
jgi:lysozyme